jgi:hypothetical protein
MNPRAWFLAFAATCSFVARADETPSIYAFELWTEPTGGKGFVARTIGPMTQAQCAGLLPREVEALSRRLGSSRQHGDRANPRSYDRGAMQSEDAGLENPSCGLAAKSDASSASLCASERDSVVSRGIQLHGNIIQRCSAKTPADDTIPAS